MFSENIEFSDSPAQILAEIERFCPLKSIECGLSKFRAIDGTCNNVEHPSWGANYAPMQRVLKPVYSDGVSEIRVSIVDGIPLPNVRLLSNLFFGAADRKSLKVNMLVAHWAHFIYTDLVHIGSTQLSQGNKQIPLPCCSSETLHPECLPVIVDADDPRYGGFLSCMPYARTTVAPRPFCALGPREQANQATSYLDASVIYGSTPNRGNILRTFRDGILTDLLWTSAFTVHVFFDWQLLTSTESINGNMPPTSQIVNSTLVGSSLCASNGGKICFLSGTGQVNFLPSIATLHTIWIRQHNRIASHLLMHSLYCIPPSDYSVMWVCIRFAFNFTQSRGSASVVAKPPQSVQFQWTFALKTFIGIVSKLYKRWAVAIRNVVGSASSMR
uniref:Chorion peroxidase n=1 Tax=Ascaris lumbricoides TaxID=6252 RepID=A0A0M3ITK8_ASCLU